MYGRFGVALPLTKAYKSGDGKMHVVGTASDTLPDLHDDRMSEKAADAMAKQATESALPLLDNHRATFGFGKTVEGDPASIESRERSEMAGDLDAVATYLDLLRERLCPACRLIEMVERVSINGGAGVKNNKPAR